MCEHLKFDRMQTNSSVNLDPLLDKMNFGFRDVQNGSANDSSKFIRKGKIGDWKNYFSEEMTKKFDEWIELNSKESDLVFDYE